MPRSIEDAQRQLAEQLIELPGVAGVGIGEDKGSPCLRVWVVACSEDLSIAIPREVAGFPVIVEESGRIHALDEPV